ncbi:MAG: MFS transporter [Armatimonadota bacterium]|nr:MFS transporter [bacterium]MDW8320158.1 MFS transporter [Armatimonadota bacterium]
MRRTRKNGILLVQDGLDKEAVLLRAKVSIAGYYFLLFAAVAFTHPFFPVFLRERGFSYGQVGAVLSVFSLTGAVASILLGWRSDQARRRRRYIIGAMLVGAAGYLLFPHVYSFGVALLLAAVIGGCIMSSQSVMMALVVDLFRHKGTAGSFGQLRVFGTIGYLLVLLILVLWRNSLLLEPSRMFFSVALLLALSALVVLLTPETPEEAEESARLSVTEVLYLLRQRDIVLYIIAHFCFVGALMTATSNLSLYLQWMGASKPFISLAYMTSALFEMPFMVLMGKLSDRIGRTRVLAIAFISLPVRLLLLTAFRAPVPVLLTQTMHGLTFSVVTAVSMAFIADRVEPRLRASGQGLLMAAASLASATMPLVAGLIADGWGLPALYGALLALSLVGTTVFFSLARHTAPAEASMRVVAQTGGQA